MKYRVLGSSGLRVSELFLGAMTFGEQGGVGAPLAECERMLEAYADAGGNVIDTAINYRGGESEKTVGQLLKGRRDRFVLATKYGVSRDRDDPNGAGSHRKNLRLSLETSLRRLDTDYLDLYWLHIHDRHTPVEETMRALDDAVTAGKVLAIGISDTPAWIVSRAMTLAEWRGWAPFVGLQVEYSLLQRDVERELLPLAEAFGLNVAAWSPLGGGVLSGKFTGPAGPQGGTRIAADSISERDLEIARAVDAVAGSLGVSPAQVAIAWTMTRSPLVHPMLGARTVEQLTDNLGALDVELPAEALAALDEAAPIKLGFPHDFNGSVRQWVFGAADSEQVESRPVPRP
ncbi:MAG: putative oxidoreductase [Acidimicrobiia bacterium]|nr:putative oxidoreductase [Acidimicrobiia bacterium]